MPVSDETLRSVFRAADEEARPNPRMREHVLRTVHRGTPAGGVTRRLRWIGAVAVCLLIAVALTAFPFGDVAHAMERKVLHLRSYRGILEMTAVSPASESTPQPLVQEIWWQDGRYVVKGDDSQLYGDGEQVWEVTPSRQSATVHWDLGEFSQQPYNLRWIVENVSHNQHQKAGQETILGRDVVRLDGTSAGGWPYSVWIDVETDLPLQFLQSNPGGLEQLWRFTTLDVNPTIDQSFFDYEPPAGWRVNRQPLGRRVNTVAEAQASVDFTILPPGEAPGMIIVDERQVAPGAAQQEVQMDCGGTVISEARATGPFAAPLTDWVTIGQAAGTQVVFDGDQIEWRQGDVEIIVRGTRSLEIAKEMLPDLKLPDPGLDLAAIAKSRVVVDLEQARLTQQRADAGQPTPQLFLERVVRDFTESAATLTLEASTGAQAVVGLSDGPYLRVYLLRPIKQNPMGIWVVAGYDPR